MGTMVMVRGLSLPVKGSKEGGGAMCVDRGNSWPTCHCDSSVVLFNQQTCLLAVIIEGSLNDRVLFFASCQVIKEKSCNRLFIPRINAPLILIVIIDIRCNE